MPDERQEYDGRFKLTFVAIAIVHLLLLGGLLFFSLSHPSKKEENIVWINPGSFAGSLAAGENASAEDPQSTPFSSEESKATPPPEKEKREAAPEPTPPLLPEPTQPPPDSELPVPASTVTPLLTPKLSPSPTPKPTPRPPPTPKPTPKTTPRPTPKATPKPSPKPSEAPKPSHKSEVKPKGKAKEKPEVEASPKPEISPKLKASPAKPSDKGKSKPLPGPTSHSGEADEAKSSNIRAENGSGGVSRTEARGGHGGGTRSGSGDSALSAYVGILTNRFQAAWNQPTGEMAMGKTLEVTVKLKVEADGRVTEFTIVEGSGNAVVDESVREAGNRITRLPPPPNSEVFSAPVRFELGN
jgi:TonB family protein